MAWAGQSQRRAPLPRHWAAIRQRILERDNYRCQLAGPRCTHAATHIDHLGAPDDHRDHMLRALCQTCHMQRTQQQAQAARPPRKRDAEAHPGLIGAPTPHPR